jgi:hypothetical protein
MQFTTTAAAAANTTTIIIIIILSYCCFPLTLIARFEYTKISYVSFTLHHVQ